MLRANNGTTISLETWLTIGLVARHDLSPQEALELIGNLPEEDRAFFTRVMQAAASDNTDELIAIADELEGDPQ